MRNSYAVVAISVLIAIGALFLLRYGMTLEFDNLAYMHNRSLASVIDSMSSMQVQRESERTDIYTVLAAGDIMLDRGVESQAKRNGGYDYSFEKISSILNEADIVFGNLEGSVSDVGADTGKPYSFRFEPEVANVLRRAGFDVLSLANNHILDWGRDSLCATHGNLRSADILPVGAGCDENEAERPAIMTLPDGTRVGFLAFTEFYAGGYARADAPGLARYTEENMIARTQQLSRSVDVVMVSMHWGHEYHLRSIEAQQNLAHKLLEAGADVILGHHPHVVQEIERHEDGWVIYSLGNFIFDQKFSEQTMRGLLARIYIADGEVLHIQPLITQLDETYQVSLPNDQKYSRINSGVLEEMHREYHRQGAVR